MRNIAIILALTWIAACETQKENCSRFEEVPSPEHVFSEKEFASFLVEAVSRSAGFRRQLLQSEEPNVANAALLTEAILAFQQEAPCYLQGRKDIAGFQLSEERILEAITGSDPLSGTAVYGPFQGRWHGQWDAMQVDHDWEAVVTLDEPKRIDSDSDPPLWLCSYQYCWVGDGYGLNLVVSNSGDPNAKSFLLGHVVHVENGDPGKPIAQRPHVGIFVGNSKLIWVTAGEVFFEERYQQPSGAEAYAITGFSYDVSNYTLHATRCYQAIYTRDPQRRRPWYHFDLELKIASAVSSR